MKYKGSKGVEMRGPRWVEAESNRGGGAASTAAASAREAASRSDGRSPTPGGGEDTEAPPPPPEDDDSGAVVGGGSMLDFGQQATLPSCAAVPGGPTMSANSYKSTSRASWADQSITPAQSSAVPRPPPAPSTTRVDNYAAAPSSGGLIPLRPPIPPGAINSNGVLGGTSSGSGVPVMIGDNSASSMSEDISSLLAAPLGLPSLMRTTTSSTGGGPGGGVTGGVGVGTMQPQTGSCTTSSSSSTGCGPPTLSNNATTSSTTTNAPTSCTSLQLSSTSSGSTSTGNLGGCLAPTSSLCSNPLLQQGTLSQTESNPGGPLLGEENDQMGIIPKDHTVIGTMDSRGGITLFNNAPYVLNGVQPAVVGGPLGTTTGCVGSNTQYSFVPAGVVPQQGGLQQQLVQVPPGYTLVPTSHMAYPPMGAPPGGS
ncbi:unnamed protein product [Amoebophrya sp. A25]|nr:unnamed protein product [Amoebophrya sp. A25]|eukprot:GSA25T00019153001.1